MTITTYLKPLILFGTLISSLASAHSDDNQRNSCETRLAPGSLNGYTINYQVLTSKSDLADTPFKGVIVSEYRNKRFSSQGVSTLDNNTDPSREYSEGSYNYDQVGCNKAIEAAVLRLPHFARRTTQLTFTSKNSGTWEQNVENGQTILSGKFSLIKSDARAIAADTNIGFHHALIIKSTVSDLPPEAYPRAGLVVQTYKADGTMTFTGTGPGTIDSTGTFTYKRVSPNTGVEEAVQTSAFFTFPYTMVYTFETPSSGTWEQNFANGLIKFSGTFDSFPAQ